MTFVDRSDEVLEAFGLQKAAALEAIGLRAEGYAKRGAPVDTGNLRNSISHATLGDTAYIGTNVEYAPYQEFGTIYIAAKHFLQNAAQGHGEEFKRIGERYLKGG